MEHIILSIVCFALVLLAGMLARGENEPAEKNLSLDLLKNEINDLRRQMKDVDSRVWDLENENDELKSDIKVLKNEKHELEHKMKDINAEVEHLKELPIQTIVSPNL